VEKADVLDYFIRRLEELARGAAVGGEGREEPAEDPVEGELDDRMFEACEEIESHLKEVEGGGARLGCWSCYHYARERALEVELRAENVVFDAAEIENIRRIIEKHGLAVNRVEIDVWVDEVAVVQIRFRVALPADDERLLAGARWLFA